jgi:hypothetical protein
MATQTFCRIGFAQYGGYEADYFCKGSFRHVYFSDSRELARRMAIDGAGDREIEAAIDVLEHFELEHSSYPLFRPAEAVADFGEADGLDWCSDRKSAFWEYVAATSRVGAVIAPWVFVMIGARWLIGGWR